jgi:hypothetical protein
VLKLITNDRFCSKQQRKIMIQPILLEKLEALPESLQTEVLHYVEFLSERYADAKPEDLQDKPKTRRLFSSMKGTFKLPLPEDFDAPMERLNAEQKAALEKKYGYGSLVGKITIADDFDEPLEDLKDYM